MILRVVLAVIVATALVAVSLPAIERASVESTEMRMRASVSRFQTSVQTLPERTDPVSPDTSVIHQTLTLRLPERTWTSMRVSHVTIEPAKTGGILRWKVADGPTHTLFVEGVPLKTPRHPTGVTLSEPGTHRFSLTLETRRRNPVVVVRKLP